MSYTGQTDGFGNYTKGLSAGPYTVAMSKIGFEPESRQVTITNSDQTVRFSLKKKKGAVNFDSTITAEDASVPGKELQTLLRSDVSPRIPDTWRSDALSVISALSRVE